MGHILHLTVDLEWVELGWKWRRLDCCAYQMKKRKKKETPVRKQPCTCFAINWYNAEEVQAHCYLKFFAQRQTIDLFRGEIVWGFMLISVEMGVYLTCVTWSEHCVCVCVCVCVRIVSQQSPTSVTHRTPPCCYKWLPELQWLHHLVEVGGPDPFCVFPRGSFHKVKGQSLGRQQIQNHFTYFVSFPQGYRCVGLCGRSSGQNTQ